MRHALMTVAVIAMSAASSARAQDQLPQALRGVGIDQRLDEQVPLDLEFRDETGQTVRLAEYFGSKPVILVLAYYKCPMLCTLVLNGLVRSLLDIPFDVGNQFAVVTVSFDARDTPALAAAKKKTYLERYGRSGAAEGWHFLTGTDDSIRRLTEAVGFHYSYDPKLDQFAHASGIMVLTPRGKIARYFFGVDFRARDLRLALVEASENKIGSLEDGILLFCYHYDPATGRYGLVILNLVRLGGVLTMLGLGTFLLLMWRRERRKKEAGTLSGICGSP